MSGARGHLALWHWPSNMFFDDSYYHGINNTSLKSHELIKVGGVGLIIRYQKFKSFVNQPENQVRVQELAYTAGRLGHDCSIRLWNVDNKTCVQEITSHRKKFDEAIFDVTFHPSKPYIASAGADALAKVFV